MFNIIYKRMYVVVDLSDFGVSYGIAYVALALPSFHLCQGETTESEVVVTVSPGSRCHNKLLAIFIDKV